MDDNNLRQTGRTTKMIIASLKLAGNIPLVYIVSHNIAMSQDSKRKFLELINLVPAQQTANTVTLMGTEYRFYSFREKSRYIVGKTDHAVYYDHIVKGEL
jgi:hypothetical protein